MKVFLKTLPELPNVNKKFDIIYSVGVVFHLNKAQRVQLFENIKKILRPTGRLILSYNEICCENTKDGRVFYYVNRATMPKETGLSLTKREIVKDIRGIEWIMDEYKRT